MHPFIHALLFSALTLGVAPSFEIKSEGWMRVHITGVETDVRTLRVTGQGGGDIDCYLYGPDKKFVSRDDGGNNSCVVHTKPGEAGEYQLLMFNHGLKDTFTISSS
jgi:hypothetical protein